MISTRRPAVLALVLALVLGTAATAYALRADRVDHPQSVTSAHVYWKEGPVATFGSDYESQQAMRVTPIAVPDGTWDAVVTVSFDYATHGPGPFSVVLWGAKHATVRPASHPLPRAEDGARPVTVRFLLTGLEGGRTYELVPGVAADHPSGAGEFRIAFRRTLMTVDLTPAG